MNDTLDDADRRNALESFAASSGAKSGGGNEIAPAAMFAAPAERVFGAQPIAIKRKTTDILQELKAMAAAAGDDWFYRFPVRSKVKNEETGKEEFVTTYIEGPSIKCANNVARLYGNCDLDCRVMDLGDSYMFYARFMDLESGYSLTRPFRQRKNQRTMKTDAGRAEDIVFQIGASKALRNVVNNALEFFTGYAMAEAKQSIISKVGQKLPEYRDRVKTRLAQLNIDIKRVEHYRGRTIDRWIAEDVALTIAEIQAINDGMARAEDTWPVPGQEQETIAGDESEKKTGMDNFADKSSPQKETPESSNKAAQGSGAATDRPASEEGANTPDNGKGNPAGGTSEAGSGPAKPTTDKEYDAYARAWIAAGTDADKIDAQWKDEKALRNDCKVDGGMRDDLAAIKSDRVAALRKPKG